MLRIAPAVLAAVLKIVSATVLRDFLVTSLAKCFRVGCYECLYLRIETGVISPSSVSIGLMTSCVYKSMLMPPLVF